MRPLPLSLALALAAGLAAPAADPVRHRIMFAEYGKGPNRLVEVDPDGQVAWEYSFSGISVIFQPLADGRDLRAVVGQQVRVAPGATVHARLRPGQTHIFDHQGRRLALAEDRPEPSR